MPHDYAGATLKEGDIVILRARVTNLAPGEKDCNCTFTIVIPDFLDESHSPAFAGNTRLGIKTGDNGG